MNTHEILNTVRGNELLATFFGGVFASDTLPSVQDLTKKKPICLIMNSDPILSQGRHWLGLFLNENSTVEFFDSYGCDLQFYDKHWKKYLFSFCHRIDRQKYRLQSWFSNVCAEFCITFCHLRLKGIPFADIVSSFYDINNQCKNDIKSVRYVEENCQIRLTEELQMKVQVCRDMHLNLL
jgi:hypothetical protein